MKYEWSVEKGIEETCHEENINPVSEEKIKTRVKYWFENEQLLAKKKLSLVVAVLVLAFILVGYILLKSRLSTNSIHFVYMPVAIIKEGTLWHLICSVIYYIFAYFMSSIFFAIVLESFGYFASNFLDKFFDEKYKDSFIPTVGWEFISDISVKISLFFELVIMLLYIFNIVIFPFKI